MTLIHAHLPSRALIAVDGADWRSFLQGQLTQDVETLQAGEARFAALLTPQGRLLFDMFVVGREDGCWLDVEAQHREALIQRLAIYRLRAKVDLAPDATRVSALWPPQSPSATAPPQAGEHRGASDPPPLAGEVDRARRETEGASGAWVPDPRLPALGWRGYGADAPTTAEESAYDAHRLALGVPGPADWGTDRTYPIEADFDLLAGIDFRKGCFVGQETTSRMKRRGQIKTRMLPIAFEGPPPAPGAEVLAGDLRAGEVRSGREGRAIALLRLDRISGPLTVEGRLVEVEPPAWMDAP